LYELSASSAMALYVLFIFCLLLIVGRKFLPIEAKNPIKYYTFAAISGQRLQDFGFVETIKDIGKE
jgi:hypothetical protein